MSPIAAEIIPKTTSVIVDASISRVTLCISRTHDKLDEVPDAQRAVNIPRRAFKASFQGVCSCIVGPHRRETSAVCYGWLHHSRTACTLPRLRVCFFKLFISPTQNRCTEPRVVRYSLHRPESSKLIEPGRSLREADGLRKHL